ncbi:MAG TPA: hypothetical protein VGZ23_07135 [bacterium]|nr:hypothetical protein [bacterium]
MVRATSVTSRMRGARLLAGLALAVAYVVSATVAPHPPHGRIVFDRLVPQPPYRWVRPPAGRQSDNDAPQPYTGQVPLGAGGSVAAEFSTDDLQATVTLPAGVIGTRTWTRLATTVFTGSQENLAHSDRLGVFAASSP